MYNVFISIHAPYVETASLSRLSGHCWYIGKLVSICGSVWFKKLPMFSCKGTRNTGIREYGNTGILVP